MPFTNGLNKDFFIKDNSRIVLDKQYLEKNKWRFKKITGSRFSSILGIGDYACPFKTWCQIVGIYSEKMDPMRAKAGQVIEPKVRDFVSKALNIKFKDYIPSQVNWDVLGTKGSVFGGIPDGEPINPDGSLAYDKGQPMLEIKTASIDVFVNKKVKGVFELVTENGFPIVKPNGAGQGRLKKLDANGNLLISAEYRYQLGLYLHLRNVTHGIFAFVFLKPEDYAHPELCDVSQREIKLAKIQIDSSFKAAIDKAQKWYDDYVKTGISPIMTEADKTWLKEVELIK